MLSNTLILLNAFLSLTDFSKNNFYEKDFKPLQHDYYGQYMIARKQQWITYKGYTFRIYIYCEVETKLDEISKMQFSSNDINDNNQPIILEYLANLTRQFSIFISVLLYLSLDNELIYEFYEKALYKLNEKNPNINNDKIAGGGIINIIKSSEIGDLRYTTFFGVLINKKHEIMMNFVIDLYNQHYN